MKNTRIHFLAVVVFLSLGVIFWRLFDVQVLKYDFYHALAFDQHQFQEKIVPKRGEIFAGGLEEGEIYPLAVNRNMPMLYAVPREIEKPVELAEKLAEILQEDEAGIKTKLSKIDDPYEPLKRKLSDEEIQKIKELDAKGIYFFEESWRYFPENNLASHILGFVNIDGRGQYGVEGFYEEMLRGNSGFLEAEKDTFGRWIPLGSKKFQPADNGADLILTIDRTVQYVVEEKLQELAEKYSAEKGSVIVMDVETGAIKAMANFPSFNPNEYGDEKDMNIYMNSAVHDLYEPGSVFKVITMACGLDTGAVSPETTYKDAGYLYIDGYTIHNSDGKANGVQTMTEVLEKSLNTGSIFIGQEVGKDGFKEYVERFGFGEKTGIDLNGEAEGNISSLNMKSDVNYATATFGQGVAATALEMINAVSAIANGGDLMVPYIVDEIVYSDGSRKKTEPQKVKKVISDQTAAQVASMMSSVVENGHSKSARLSHHYAAGKTGTAQIADNEKGGYSEEEVHNFVGFVPAFSPRYSILVKIEKPQGVRFASESTAPVFREIADFLVNYYQIEPDKTEGKN